MQLEGLRIGSDIAKNKAQMNMQVFQSQQKSTNPKKGD